MDNHTSSTMSDEEACPNFPQPTGLKVVKTIVLSIIMSSALVGNLLVITVFKKNHSTRTNTNALIVNMAVSDLLYPVFLWPTKTVDIWLEPKRWLITGPLGQLSCKSVMFFADISSAVSVQSLVIIAIERFVAVVYPMKARLFTPHRRTKLILTTWLISMVAHSLYFFFFNISRKCSKVYCVQDWRPLPDSQLANSVYFSIVVILFGIAPLALAAVLYAATSLTLRKKMFPGNTTPGNAETRIARRQKQNRNITRMSICIVSGFALCWLPLAVVVLYILLNGVPFSSQALLFRVSLYLAYSNGAVNPWILFYFLPNFRQGLRDICGCCTCFYQTLQIQSKRRSTNRRVADSTFTEDECNTELSGNNQDGVTNEACSL